MTLLRNRSKFILVLLFLIIFWFGYNHFFHEMPSAFPPLPALTNRPVKMSWPLPAPHVTRANCRAIFQNNEEATLEGLRVKYREQSNAVSDYDFVNYHEPYRDCRNYLKRRRFIIDSLSHEEAEFSIAFSIMVFHNVAQLERLIRAIYRPQNYYCIHIDAKSTRAFSRAVESIARCLGPNIILSDTRYDVEWGHYSVLAGDLACFRQLLDNFPNWRYLINLTGEEFPLRTNLELVRILKIFNGTNSIEGTYNRRTEHRLPIAQLPFPITWYKGSVHITASRAFIKFALSSPLSQRILQALQPPVGFGDEQFFATLNHNPTLGTPGAYLGDPETDPEDYPFITRLKNWLLYPFNYPCRSNKIVRQICIWGVKDLSFIVGRRELFVNKLYDDFEPVALDCLEERYFNDTREDYNGRGTPNRPGLNYYRHLSFVRHHQ